MGPRPHRARAGFGDCRPVLLLVVLPVASAALHAHGEVATTPGAVDYAHMRRADSGALVEATGKVNVRVKGKNSQQDSIITTLENGQRDQDELVNQERTLINDTLLPKLKDFKNKIIGFDEPMTKFMEMNEQQRDTLVATTQKRVKQWKTWEFNEQQKQNRRVDSNVRALRAAQAIFNSGEKKTMANVKDFLLSWKKYVDGDYGPEGNVVSIQNKLNEKVARDTKARQDNMDRVTTALQEKIDFTSEVQSKQMEKLADKAQTSETTMQDNVERWLDYGAALLEHHKDLGRMVNGGKALIDKDRSGTQALLDQESQTMLQKWKSYVSSSNALHEKQVNDAQEDIRAMFEGWLQDQSQFRKAAERTQGQAWREFAKQLQKASNNQNAIEKSVQSGLDQQGRKVTEQERSVEREANYFGMQTKDRVKAARENAEEQQKMQMKLADLEMKQVSDANARGAKLNIQSEESTETNLKKAEKEITDLADMGEGIITEGGDKIASEEAGVASDISTVEADAEKGVQQATEAANAASASVASSEGAVEHLQTEFENGMHHSKALMDSFLSGTTALQSETQAKAAEQVKTASQDAHTKLGALAKVLSEDEQNINVEQKEAITGVEQDGQKAVAKVASQLQAAGDAITEVERESAAQDAELRQGKSAQDSAGSTAMKLVESTARAIQADNTQAQQEQTDTYREEENRVDGAVSGFSAKQEAQTAQSADISVTKLMASEEAAKQITKDFDKTQAMSVEEFDNDQTTTAATLQRVEAGTNLAGAAIHQTEARAAEESSTTENEIQSVGMKIKNQQVASQQKIAEDADASEGQIKDMLTDGSTEFAKLTESDSKEQKAQERKLEMQRVSMEASINKELGSVDQEQKQHVKKLVKGTQDLEQWVHNCEGKASNQAANFLHQFDVLAASVQATVLENEHDAEAQQKALDAHLAMVNRMLDSGLEGVDEEVKNQMRREAERLNREMKAVVDQGGSASGNRIENLARLQANSKKAIQKVMANSDTLGPELEQYKADEEAKKQLEEDFISSAAGKANQMNELRQKEQGKLMAAAVADGKKVLKSVMGALTSAEELGDDVKVALQHVSQANSAEIEALDNGSGLYFGGVDNQLQVANRESHAAQQGAASSAAKSLQVVAHTAELMNSMETTVSSEIEHLRLGMSAEQARAKASVTELSDERKELMRELHSVLGEAGGVTDSLFARRLEHLERLDDELEKQVDALEAGGHDELASVLRNSVDFAKKMLANLAHMKFVMYDNLELEKSTDSDAAFTSEKYQNLRDQLVQQAQVSVEKNADFEKELQQKLKALGVAGSQASKHLEGMLKGLTFQLATGEKEGFDALLEQLAKDFGDSFGHESAVKGLIKSGLNDLAKKQGRLNTVIDGVTKSMTEVEGRQDRFEEKLGINLDRIQELHKMSDKELWDKIREIKAVVNQLASKEAARATSVSFLDREHSEAQEKAWKARMAALEERMAREKGRRVAAEKEEARLRAMMRTLRMVREFQHRQD